MNTRAVPALPSRTQRLADTARARELAHGWDTGQTPAADVFGHVIEEVATGLHPDAILTLDAGNFSTWIHRVLRMQPSQTMLAAACGAMGMGVPAALAASLRHPTRQVQAFCGDGGFLMTGNELTTAVGRRLPLKVVVANNASYGTIRSYQERQFPGAGAWHHLAQPGFRRAGQGLRRGRLSRVAGGPGARDGGAVSGRAGSGLAGGGMRHRTDHGRNHLVTVAALSAA